MAKTGIDWITYYTPGLYLDIEELAEKRGIEPAKLKKGLGLTAMALCDTDEDTVTMASEAVLKLIEQRERVQVLITLLTEEQQFFILEELPLLTQMWQRQKVLQE